MSLCVYIYMYIYIYINHAFLAWHDQSYPSNCKHDLNHDYKPKPIVIPLDSPIKIASKNRRLDSGEGSRGANDSMASEFHIFQLTEFT